jgi:hypothetical protein
MTFVNMFFEHPIKLIEFPKYISRAARRVESTRTKEVRMDGYGSTEFLVIERKADK